MTNSISPELNTAEPKASASSEDRRPFFDRHSQLVIAIDAMGGDHGPRVTVEGAWLAYQREKGRLSGPLSFVLFGDQAKIEPELERFPELKPHVAIHHTDQSIAMDEKPAQALRKRGTSLFQAITSVKEGRTQAIVSAGNTGALMALSKMILKMLTDDLERPAIACSWPHPKGYSSVLDVGANVNSDAHQLVEFALMGAAFHKAIHGKSNPKVGLLNVGSEDVKGHDEVRMAHKLLRESEVGLDYYGFVEGDDLCAGTVDVVVTDGFTGNIALKTAEGTARFIKTLLKDAFMSSWISKLGALLASSALKAMSKRIDPGASNGGPLLGLKGIVIKSHGGAEAWSFSNAISVAISLAISSFQSDLSRDLAYFSQIDTHESQSDAPLEGDAREKVS